MYSGKTHDSNNLIVVDFTKNSIAAAFSVKCRFPCFFFFYQFDIAGYGNGLGIKKLLQPP